MRVNDIISKVKNKLLFLGFQNKVDYFTDYDILAIINDAQNDIISKTECLEGIYTINVIPNVNEYQLPSYIGRIIKVVDDKFNEYEYLTPEKYVLDNSPLPHYTLLNSLLLVRAYPQGVSSLNIYYRNSTVKDKATLDGVDISIPPYYDKAIEYYTLFQLLPSEKAVEYFQLYNREISEKQNLFLNRVEKPKPKSEW